MRNNVKYPRNRETFGWWFSSGTCITVTSLLVVIKECESAFYALIIVADLQEMVE